LGSAATSGNATKGVTISCKHWRNPVTPTAATGFRLLLSDFDDIPMENT
jgi:hypothetical protein